jgi:nucleoside triphosphate pyrophosphatase
VRMLPLGREEIEWYVATGEPLDKAGSYAVQGIGAMFIESVHGSYTNVVGLPLSTLYQMLKKAGILILASQAVKKS